MNDNLTGTVLPSSNGVVVKEDNVDYYGRRHQSGAGVDCNRPCD